MEIRGDRSTCILFLSLGEIVISIFKIGRSRTSKSEGQILQPTQIKRPTYRGFSTSHNQSRLSPLLKLLFFLFHKTSAKLLVPFEFKVRCKMLKRDIFIMLRVQRHQSARGRCERSKLSLSICVHIGHPAQLVDIVATCIAINHRSAASTA